MDVDVVVIGGGAMGSAAAWQMSRRGRSVLLLEQFDEGHQLGASHGATRNFNTAYSEADYLDLVAEARILWDALAEETGRQLLDLVGLVNHGNLPRLRATRAAHKLRGIESYFLPASAAAERWKGMNFRGEVLVVPGAGRVRAAEALLALRQASEAHFQYSTPVRDIRVLAEESVVVVTDSQELTARNVVVTAGAWTNKVLGRMVRLPELVVTQEQPAHFLPLDDSLTWPSFNHNPDQDDPRDDYWYSPVYGMLTPGEGIKAGWHGVGPVMDPDARTFLPEPVQLEALVRYVREWLPGVDPESVVPISCTYTSTANEDFVLDRFGPVVVGAGFSGHGFKFTPAIGRVLADLVDGVQAPSRFSASRD
ncbi:FAD-dependent oxidoreductase [Arthrobacter sp. M4]|uniref:FAD-dependent oxidoreductase n=1 Tax=Arthrobacter sp. M4 TaxID=218160 RepID=UPI001CDC6589|nr:FAD-dependent oxidoreductase [Arthrobacter sp. M4]MCA4131443.1 FAD-dependent oxidoreductase [Arthrobacter sp. M4]